MVQQKIKNCSLEEALDFNGDEVIYKFMESYDVTFEEGAELFEETKKWLWYCMHYEKSFIDKSMLMIDNMWHTFILFTKLYSQYCNSKFGIFLHHSPATKKEKDKFRLERKENIKKVLQDSYQKNKKQYEAIHDLLGPKTLIKWFGDFSEKYSIERINKITKPTK